MESNHRDVHTVELHQAQFEWRLTEGRLSFFGLPFELPVFDVNAKRATVIVRNPWELYMQRGAQVKWGCPFLPGKLIGIFSHVLGTSCWADERMVALDDGAPTVEFQIYAANTTIAAELEQLRDDRNQESEREIERKTQELVRSNEERALLQEQIIQMQAATLAELSTPLIPFSDHILIRPLIGSLDSQRAQRVIEALLEGTAAH